MGNLLAHCPPLLLSSHIASSQYDVGHWWSGNCHGFDWCINSSDLRPYAAWRQCLRSNRRFKCVHTCLCPTLLLYCTVTADPDLLAGSSLLADFLHTSALFAIILYFMFQVFTTNDKIGSVRAMYDGLVEAGTEYPIEGNRDGSYLTFRSKSGLIFMALNLITNLATVLVDQTYYVTAQSL